MSKRNLGLIALAFLVCCLSGCIPQHQIAISPDGATAVIINGDKMTFRDIVDHRPDRVVRLPDTETKTLDRPVYSPDGTSAIVQWGNDAVIVDAATLKSLTVKNFRAPYAWKADGSEVIGSVGNDATVYHPRSGQMVRSYPMPTTPTQVAWIGNGRDVAFASGREIMLLQHGHFTKKRTAGDVGWLGYDNSREKLVWAEILTKDRSDITPDIAIKQAEADLSGESTLLERIKSKTLLASDTAAIPLSLAVSPDGAHLTCCGLSDASPPGVFDKYIKLNAHEQQHRKELDALSKRLRFRVVNTVARIGDGAGRVALLYRSSPFGLKQLDSIGQSAWMPDGKAVALYWGDKIRIEPVNQ